MAIAFFVSDGYGGYGDFLYALKAIAALKKRLRDKGYQEEIYLVTQTSGQKKIQKLKGDQEFNVVVKTTKEFQQLQQQPGFQLDYYIEGPVFHPWADHQIKINASTPILLLPEYSNDSNVSNALKLYVNSLRLQLSRVYSGFGSASNKGILITDELTTVARKKLNSDHSYLNEYWNEVDLPIKNIILANQTSDHYYQNTDLSFQYSYDSSNVYQTNSCEHYLSIQQLYSGKSHKNQDIIAIGTKSEVKKRALKNILPDLKENGFGKVVYVNLQSGMQEVLYDDKKPGQKVYRMLYSPHVSHKQMIAFQALSGDLVGATGDQSLGETLSAGKLMVYECLSHKIDLANGFISSLYKITKDKKVKRLAELLLREPIHSSLRHKHNRAELKKLLHDEGVVAAYKRGCQELISKNNLVDSILEKITPVLVDVAKLSPEEQLALAIQKNQTEEAKRLILAGASCIKQNKLGVNSFTRAVTTNNFDLIKFMLEDAVAKNKDIDLAITGKDYEGHSALSWLPATLDRTHPDLHNKISIELLRGAIRNILTYKPANTKRAEQVKLLQEVQQLARTHNNQSEARKALIGALLLVRKSIRKESFFYHGSSLLAKIEKELTRLEISTTDKQLEESCLAALKNFSEKHSALLSNFTFVSDFNSIANIKLDLSALHPRDIQSLSKEQLACYQALANQKKGFSYLSRKDASLRDRGLTYSIFKLPDVKGFYLLENKEGSTLRKGEREKVKQGYYCDEAGIINGSPVAIKIEKGKNPKELLQEVGMFSQAKPTRQDAHLYKSGIRKDRKAFSIFPLRSGMLLDKFLRANEALEFENRLQIARAVIQALASAHSHQVAHLDLKLKNIYYDPSINKAYLVDSDCSRKFQETGDAKLQMGDYMPPECFRNESSLYVANEKVDVYSAAVVVSNILGISLYSLIESKLQEALKLIQNQDIKNTIENSFQYHCEQGQVGKALYQLPSECYQNKDFAAFNRKFNSQVLKLPQINVMPPDLIKLLSCMFDPEPSQRPTSNEVFEQLVQIDEQYRNLEHSSNFQLSFPRSSL